MVFDIKTALFAIIIYSVYLTCAESTQEDVSPSYRTSRSPVRLRRLADMDSRLSPNIPTRARTQSEVCTFVLVYKFSGFEVKADFYITKCSN